MAGALTVVATAVVSEVESQVTSQVAESLIGSFKREISYVFMYKSYINDLESQLKELEYLRQRVEQAVEHAERQGDEIFEDVKAWLIAVKDFTGSIAKPIIENEDDGLCRNLLKRYYLSKKAVKAAEECGILLKKGNFGDISFGPAPERPVLKLGRGYQDFDSRMSIFQEIMEVLKDSNADTIGIYGPGGVGKTTLVKQLARQVMEDKLFDVVVMAEVTQKPDLKTIQNKIASDLGLEFKQQENMFQRAEQLGQRLRKVKRVLVILDNIWKKLALHVVGIPFGDDETDRKDNNTRCTVLLTSRSRDLLCRDMNSQKNFLIEVLSKGEARQLFGKIVGDSVKKSDFQRIADEIVDKCGGLPVALNTIANALKNKSLPIWEDALDQLRNSNPTEIHGMHKDVYSSIELSYEFLESEEAKKLFRLCGLQKYGSRIHVDDLVMYGTGLGLFSNVKTLKALRNRMHSLIDNLKSSSLLLDSDNEDDVKMHDIIHAVAVTIARKERMFNIQNVTDLEEELEDIIQKDPTGISLPNGVIDELPERIKCLKIKLFVLLSKHSSSLQIPNLFFEGMEELRVLHFSRTRLPSLPSSQLGCLINLQTLCLDDCQLEDIAIVGQLKKLEIFSFRNSNIKQLPVAIGELTRLQLLDLSSCWSLELVAPNVISKLSRLQELYMVNSFSQWESVGGTNASIVELKGLSKLTTLEIHVRDAQIISQDLVSVELERYRIFIGNAWVWSSKYKKSRLMKLNGLEKCTILGHGMKMILKRTENLFLDNVKGFHDVFRELDDGEGFLRLKHLHVENCSEILHIVSLVGRPHYKVFLLLESLFLSSLINLKKVCHGQITEDQSFSNLRTIAVTNCGGLKHLFSFSLAKNLLWLRELKVSDCENLEMIVGPDMENPTTSWGFKEIIAEDDPEEKVIFPNLELVKVRKCRSLKYIFSHSMVSSLVQLQQLKIQQYFSMEAVVVNTTGLRKDEGILFFPNLQYLDLSWLQTLKSFAMGIHLVAFPSLFQLRIIGCRNLRRFISMSSSEGTIHTEIQHQSLFDEKVLLPCLEKLEIFKIKELREIWHHQLASDSLIQLKCLMIENCEEIMSIFPPMALFSSLEVLRITNVHYLREIWHHQIVSDSLSNLRDVGIENCCYEQANIFPSMVRLPNLERLCIQVVHGMREIWHHQLASDSLSKLKELKIGSCHQLMSIFPPLLLKISNRENLREIWHHPPASDSLIKLEYLVISDCDELMNIFSPMVSLPKLRELKIFRLPKLLHLWKENSQPSKIFECLESLIVSNCDSVEEVCHLEQLNADEHFEPFFPELDELKLTDLPKLKRFCNFTGNIIELPKLSKLWIENCHDMETFISNSTSVKLAANREPQEQTTEENFMVADIQPLFDEKVSLPWLEELKLSRLPKLFHLWQENSQPSKVFKCLETLEISECNKLKKLIPSLSCLENLTTLKVSKCDRLINIVALSTVQCLKRLEIMTITDCKNIEEILEHSEDGVKNCIVFSQLVYLRLDCLPSLSGFCLGNYNLEFPSLELVVVRECPKMKIFSAGVLGTPFLQNVQDNEEGDGYVGEGRWEGNLNSTVQQLYKEMNVQSYSEE